MNALPAPTDPWHPAVPPARGLSPRRAAERMAPAPVAPPAPAALAAPSRRWAGVAVVALHALGVAALLQAQRLRTPTPPPAPVQVQLLAPAPPPTPSPAEPLPTPSPATRLPLPTALPALPLPDFTTAPAVPAVAAPALPATAGVPAAEPARVDPVARPAHTPPPPPAVPKTVPATSLRYRVEPPVEVPRLSRRAGESGRVQLRVLFDADGRPRQVELLRSSGFARLDTQALEAMQAARIHPYLEDGRAIEVLAVATLDYALD